MHSKPPKERQTIARLRRRLRRQSFAITELWDALAEARRRADRAERRLERAGLAQNGVIQ